jgi:hypothetical protein
MFGRLVRIFSLVGMGLALDGCTKCGPVWDDWVQSPKSCKSDRSCPQMGWRAKGRRLALRLTR